MFSYNKLIATTTIAMVALLSLLAPVNSVRLSDDEKATMVKKHNEARCAVSPSASVMPRLVWDTQLEQVAQRYADSCPGYAHNALRSTWYSEIGGSAYVGENLCWGYNSPAEAVDAWVNEKLHYKYQIFDMNINSAGCDTGDWSSCGHYTQIIWAGTTRVGCARVTSTCANIGGGDWFYVCNYATGGNFVGQMPYLSGSATTDACASLSTATVKTTVSSNLQTCRTTPGNYVSSGIMDASSITASSSPTFIADNDLTTFWAPATSDPNEWVRISLDGSFLVDKVRILFKDAAHTPRSVSLMSKADASGIFVTVKNWSIAASDTSAKAVISFDPPIKSIALRVKILASGTKKTQISEFVMNGKESC